MLQKTKMQKKREFRELTGNKPTKKYDKVAMKIRKLLSATAQTFIPELCEALKQDWFPTMPHKDLQKNSGIREEIRSKIISEWSNDSIYSNSQDNIWKESTINIYLPDWLKNPNKQTESHIEKLARMREEKLKRKISLNQAQKQNLDQIAETLSDDVIVPEDESAEEKAEQDQKFWETAQELGISEYGETGKSTRELTGDISLHAYKLFAALTNNKSPPNDSDDLLVDYIRPSREFRKGLMLEVDRRRRIAIHNILHYVCIASEDMIEIIREIDSKEEEQN
ncbi:MAG: hypothetical protein ACXWE7_12050 [Nitrososphaeraceae archaeon]